MTKPSSYWFGSLVTEGVVYYVPESGLRDPGMVHDYVRESARRVGRFPRVFQKHIRMDSIQDADQFRDFLDDYQRSTYYKTSESVERGKDELRNIFERGNLVPDQYKLHFVLKFGFPASAMAVDYSKFPGPGGAPILANSGVVVGNPVEMPTKTVFYFDHSVAYAEPALPTRIIWSGFLVNTAFNAIVLSGLWFTGKAGVGLLHRRRGRRRLSRGVCPKCAYDLGGRMACPECGWTA